MGIDVDFVDFGNEDEVQSKLKSGDGKIKLFWLETPTNPTLKVTCIRSVADLAKQNNALLAVDNTFCSPYFQNPAELGADLVVHSVTKYINGHSDVVMGVVCTNDEDIYKQLRFTQNGVGAIPSPFDCFLALRGLKTLHLRMEAAARCVVCHLDVCVHIADDSLPSHIILCSSSATQMRSLYSWKNTIV